jgi:hypothetical protein
VLPIRLRRSEVTRSEVQGLIGMMRADGQRYTLAHLATQTFGEALEAVKASPSADTLVIPCAPAEFEQFTPPATTHDPARPA